jgi:hypothetical protein
VTTSEGVDRAALARGIAAAVMSVPGVAALSPGTAMEASTLYPGGRVIGVVIGEHEVTVHFVAEQLPLQDVLERVRAAVAAAQASLDSHLAIAMVVDDLDLERLPPRPSPTPGKHREQPPVPEAPRAKGRAGA